MPVTHRVRAQSGGMISLTRSACIARAPERIVSRRGVTRRITALPPKLADEVIACSGSSSAGTTSHGREAERDSLTLSRRVFGPSIAAALLVPAVFVEPPRAAAGSVSPAAGIETVVLRTASITPDQAANYLVEAVPGLVKRDDAPAGRAVVTGAGGIALELRGGGDEGDEGDDGSSSSVKLPSEPRDPPKLAAIFVGTDNPAKARNTALRNGAIPQREGPGSGERCAGDAYAGCVANLIGFPLVFVKTRSPKPSLVRVAVSGALDASVVVDALGGDASGLSVDPAGKGQVGVVERAAEDPPPQGRGVILTPAAGGGGLELRAGDRGSAAWRVLGVAATGGKVFVPP